jgi:hypothetical protein
LARDAVLQASDFISIMLHLIEHIGGRTLPRSPTQGFELRLRRESFSELDPFRRKLRRHLGWKYFERRIVALKADSPFDAAPQSVAISLA